MVVSIRQFTKQMKLYDSMLQDISEAKKYVYLETYIYDSDVIGARFRDALIQKCKEGVQVKMLLDSFGSSANEKFMESLILAGGEIRFFRPLMIKKGFFKHHHRRDHRKLLVIDDDIAYLGSSNISNEHIDWREYNLRITGKLAVKLRNDFQAIFDVHTKYIHKVKKRSGFIKCGQFQILRDVPSRTYQTHRNKYLEMIKTAKKEILLETPYFFPDRKIRKALKSRAKKGLKVYLLLPKKSDVKLMDFVKDTYLGLLHKNGVRIYYYTAGILHSKCGVVDSKKYIVGSCNLDGRGFVYNYELGVYGQNIIQARKIRKFILSGIKESELFDYSKWKKRHWFLKLVQQYMKKYSKFF